MRPWCRVSVLLALGLFASVVRAQEPPDNAEYRLGPRDLVEIKVLEIPELNVERRVSDRGTVALPLIGDFVVDGPDDRSRARTKARDASQGKVRQPGGRRPSS